jgi:Protein of unknown function (DUF3024)
VLYCSDSSGRWHRFDQASPTKSVKPLLGMIEADPPGIFWAEAFVAAFPVQRHPLGSQPSAPWPGFRHSKLERCSGF